MKQEKTVSKASTTTLRPHEREITDRRIEDLQSLVTELEDDKSDPEGSQYFTKIVTTAGEVTVLDSRSMGALSEKMSPITDLGRFALLPVGIVLQIQSLVHPTIISITKNDFAMQGDDNAEDFSESIDGARFALKASTLLLDTMIDGCDDHRLRREEIIDIIIDLVKLVKDACIVPIIQFRRSGGSENLFNLASTCVQPLQVVLRLCGNVLHRFATLIGKYQLSDRALNTLEYLTLELLVEQNSDHERDSIFTIAKFEQFRQKAMDVVAQIFAECVAQRQSILNSIFSNLEKLPVQKSSARQFQSAHELPIMTLSALFMRFVQVAATNREVQTSTGVTERGKQVLEDDSSDYEPGSSSQKAKRRQGGDAPINIARSLIMSASNIARFIAGALISRATGVAKTADKPFRVLLDLFIDDFCNVLGSPEWPASALLLTHLTKYMQEKFMNTAAKASVVDKELALVTMTRIGCGIFDFKHTLRQTKRKLDVSQSDLASNLGRRLDEALHEDSKERINDMDLLSFDGPYRIVIESLGSYLDLRTNNAEDLHSQSINGYYTSSWLDAVSKVFSNREDGEYPAALTELQHNLSCMIMDPTWLGRK